MREYTVYDGEQPVKFTGVLLSHTTSDDGRKPRWTETEIYRTRAGSYIIHKIGGTRNSGDRVLHSTQVSETAEGAIECLRFFDDDGVMTMRQVDRRALLAAVLEDEALHAAYREGITVD